MTTPWFLGNPGTFSPEWRLPFFLILIWSLVLTGLALWHAARRGEKWWFVFFLIVHTAGLVELIYLLFFVRIFSPKHTPAKRR